MGLIRMIAAAGVVYAVVAAGESDVRKEAVDSAGQARATAAAALQFCKDQPQVCAAAAAAASAGVAAAQPHPAPRRPKRPVASPKS